MRWLAQSLFVLLAVSRRIAASRSLAQTQIAPASSTGVCGDINTQVTICFPGNQNAASCEYGLSERDDQGITSAIPCPVSQLFNQSCDSIPGLIFIAYGPCQDQLQSSSTNPNATLQTNQPQLPIAMWIEVLGLEAVEEVGTLYLRGYAYQPPQPVRGLDILPNLKQIGTNSALLSGITALTIVGAEIPRLSNVTSLGGGMLVQNVPNQNFSAVFGPLESVAGSVFIAGNTALTSLAGLQDLNSSVIGNFEILSNNGLSDISALSQALSCDEAGNTSIQPSSTLVGAIEVLPSSSNGSEHCLLSTVAQACSFIGNQQCPTGTANAYSQFRTSAASTSNYDLTTSPSPSPP